MNNLTVANFSSQARKWFGELPTDWSVNPLKFVVTYNDETLSEDTDLAYEIEYADISSVELGKGIKTTESMYFEDAPSRARRVVKNGDTLISTVRTYLKAITTVEHAPDNLIASTGFAVLRPLPLIDPNYLGYFTTSSSFVDAVVAQSKGVSYPATNASDIVKLNISFPKLDIQKAIANFLDEKTAHIDALIEKKRKLLEFLAENRAAIITNAVTKGINPDAPMKDSGIDWLGAVPEDWSVNPLKFVVTYNDEILPEDTDLAYEIEYADISSVELGMGIKATESMYFEDAPSRARRVVKNGDTLISTVRTYLKAITTVEHAPDNLIASTGFAVLRPLPLIDPNYLGYFTTSSSFVDAVVAQSKGVSYPATNASDIVKLNISFPKLDIQKVIANFLDEKTAHIDVLIEKNRKLLELFTEYRSALITNAVTGKIKVV